MGSVLRAVEDLLVPPRCPACGARADPLLCHPCALRLEAHALPDLGAVRLDDGVVAVGAYAYEGVVAEVVRGLKLSGRWAVAGGLGRILRERVGLAAHLPPEVAVTWVPSTARRRRARGLELPRLLAGPDAVRLLAVTRELPDQTTLSSAARRALPAGAFVALGPVPAAVVLVDDVRTTGATATAAASALRRAGARRVVVVTFAVSGSGQLAARPPPVASTRDSSPGSSGMG